MSVAIEELSPAVIGKKLGLDLYNESGRLLLRHGVEIVPSHYNHIEKRGYRSIYLLDDLIEESGYPNSLISERLLASAPAQLREIFRSFKHESRARAYQAKTDLLSLATAILDEMNDTVNRDPLAVDLKRHEDYLYQHCVNVAVYSALIGKRLRYEASALLSLTVAALVHDFGMLFVDPAIINKSTRLAEEEFEKVKTHTVAGFKHLFNYGFLDPFCSLASIQHHENFDGTGYPKQLSADAIHEFSRIIYVADSFDAWTSDRPHRRLHSIRDTTDFIKRHAGTLFDPKIAKQLVDFFD